MKYYLGFFALIAWAAAVPAAHAQFVCTVKLGTVVDSTYFSYAILCKGNFCIVTSEAFPDTNGHYGVGRMAFQRSTDGGHTWSVPDVSISPSVGFPYLEQIDSVNMVAYDPQGFIIRTTDDGVTWQHDSIPIKIPIVEINDLSFSSQTNGMIVAGYSVFLTSDSGQHWDTIPFPSGWISRGHDYGQDKYRGYNWSTQRMYSTLDAWKTLDSTGPIFANPMERDAYILEDVAFGSGDTILAYGAHNTNDSTGFPCIVRTTDGGYHWSTVFDDTTGSTGYINALSDVNRDTIVAGITGWMNKALWSTDNGATWEVDSLLCNDTDFVGFQNDGIGLNSEGELVGAFNSAFNAVTHQPTKNSIILGRHVTSDVASNDVSDSKMQFFPNPATTSLTLTGVTTGRTVHLLDILGRELLHGKVSASGALTLDVSLLSRGIYMAMIEHDGRMLPAGRIVLAAE